MSSQDTAEIPAAEEQTGGDNNSNSAGTEAKEVEEKQNVEENKANEENTDGEKTEMPGEGTAEEAAGAEEEGAPVEGGEAEIVAVEGGTGADNFEAAGEDQGEEKKEGEDTKEAVDGAETGEGAETEEGAEKGEGTEEGEEGEEDSKEGGEPGEKDSEAEKSEPSEAGTETTQEASPSVLSSDEEEYDEYDEDEEKETEKEKSVILHPDTSFIDPSQIVPADEIPSDVGILGRGLFKFPNVTDPGVESALTNTYYRPPIYDEAGVQRYKDTCDLLDVVKLTRFINELKEEEINLRYYGLDTREIRGMSEALQRNKYVKRLYLTDNWFSSDASYHLSLMLKENCTLTHLDLNGCRIGPEGARFLSEGLLLNRSLETLNLASNCIGDEGVDYLADLFCDNNHLITLNLSNNGLTEQSAMLLGPILENNNGLQNLNFSWNAIFRKEGVKELLKGVTKNKKITSLNMSWNGLKNVGTLIRGLIHHSETMQHLDFSSNRFETDLIKAISRAIGKSETLLSIKLGNNPLLPSDCTMLLRGLLQGTSPTASLKLLDLENIWVEKDFLELQDQLKAVRSVDVKFAGVLSNYVIRGPDEKAVIFARARYEGMMPKRKKRKRDFGLLMLQLKDKPMPKAEFLEVVKKFKIKLHEDIPKQLCKEFQAPKKTQIDAPVMKEYYFKLYPDIPEEPKKKKKKGKQSKRKKSAHKKGASDDENTTSTEPTESSTRPSSSQTGVSPSSEQLPVTPSTAELTSATRLPSGAAVTSTMKLESTGVETSRTRISSRTGVTSAAKPESTTALSAAVAIPSAMRLASTASIRKPSGIRVSFTEPKADSSGQPRLSVKLPSTPEEG